MEKQNKELSFVTQCAFRTQEATKEAFGEVFGCRAKAGEFEARDGALQALI